MIKFLIIGNKNAITYKEIFPYIKNNQLWLGLNSPCDFSTPSGEITKTIAGLCRWFTNIENNKRNQPYQFEILGIANSARWIGEFPCYTIINGKKVYNRILIKKVSYYDNNVELIEDDEK